MPFIQCLLAMCFRKYIKCFKVFSCNNSKSARGWQCYMTPFWNLNGTPLQYSCLENPMDEAWYTTVRVVSKSPTGLRHFTFAFHFHALGKEMAAHSRVLAWRVPGTGEPGGLPSVVAQSQTRLKRLSSSSSSRNPRVYSLGSGGTRVVWSTQ